MYFLSETQQKPRQENLNLNKSHRIIRPHFLHVLDITFFSKYLTLVRFYFDWFFKLSEMKPSPGDGDWVWLRRTAVSPAVAEIGSGKRCPYDPCSWAMSHAEGRE